MHKLSFIVLFVCVGALLALPQPQEDFNDLGETEFAAAEHAQSIGNLLKNLPNILKKTAAWIQGLGEIGDEIHPDVGATIRKGASAVEEASNTVPDDIHTRVQGHLNHLINITRSVQDNLNETWSNIPYLKEQVDGIPGDDYILDVIESIPSSDYVDEQINEVINYFEPLAEAIGVNSSTVRK